MPGALVSRGDRISLRTLETEDVPFVQRGFANPEIRYPMGSLLKNQSELEEWIDDGGTRLVVCLEDDDADPGQPEEETVERIGVVSVSDADWRRPTLAYWLVPEVHGEGLGSEAVSLLVDHVFRTHEHPAVGAGAYEWNDASRGLLESLGFEKEGRVHRDLFVDGEYVDTIQYVLFREAWLE
ncbi:GNAT family N-acetyltransferase [Natrononativus amylolyticus]|uniref:GNAT family N-acetyltransferase n=1 Tax=Natrononativus amylolyticus TaxID=2963434 RepID=UPI0020CC0195|nr:GNAT family protein [Natrononativus amylolyticus]